MKKVALALACSSILGCAGSLTREEVLTPSAAAALGERAHVHGYERAGESYWFPGTMVNRTTLRTSSGVEQTLEEGDKIRATVTYHQGDAVPGEGVMDNEHDAGLIVAGSLLLAGGAAALTTGLVMGSSCHDSDGLFFSSCAGQALGGLGLGVLGGVGMLIGIPVLVSALDGKSVAKKRASLHVSISPAAVSLGGSF